jgi:hypothetical protein
VHILVQMLYVNYVDFPKDRRERTVASESKRSYTKKQFFLIQEPKSDVSTYVLLV